ncbi:DUF4386 domain-containing protein [Fusibacter ferrireducens]|uniref:DUF4386 domain-containing protein n=1 Tax=Fusibacter ferrireducens TaxID=2785058 RepID=A0ABR9ZYM5_9FIRM|nr:DUF4386 domain-containing protein [Fusibacter ferrireducens]MBF4695558.1 DUF4386 domain-containing protein [Fusibacter ferrireducens]
MNKLKPFRRYEIIAGIGFILATISYSIGNALVESQLPQIKSISTTITTSLTIGAVLELINSVSVITIGFMFYLRLKQFNKNLVLGYLISRFVEGTLLLVGTLSFLQSYIAPFYLHQALFNIAMLSLSIYSTIFFLALMKDKLGPHWLFLLGVIGYAALCVYASINLLPLSMIAPLWLFGPGAIFELVFPLWLMVKGFNKP